MKRILNILLVLMGATACKKQITIAPSAKVTSYLVVDGNIALGDSTTITLRRTVNLDSNAKANPELGAVVTVESAGGAIYKLIGKGNGTYVSAPLNLSAAEKYSLKITTVNGGKYASDFVPVKNSPTIDSVRTAITNVGLQIGVDTHDATNNSKYYRWEYTETYQIQSAFESLITVVQNPTAPPPDFQYVRTPAQKIYNCWISDTSNTIITTTTAKLSADKVSNAPLALILANSEKLRFRYSMLVKQYAITSDAYNYFELLKKNTEQIGGIFDPQPSELTGNLHCISNPNEPVIGFVTVGQVTQKRIFVDKTSLPANWVAETPYGSCHLDTLLYARKVTSTIPNIPPIYINEVYNLIYSGITLSVDYAPGGYTASTPICVDCTLRGSNKKPSFWK
ncbi:DUF4249 domain-containing protein [Mucilaginibacter sp. AW1-7]|uniref:DUF4249 domain-containing protein n=1 Tax=unclassified Mucilaginibacter TaxID=2617802 RepID=UPI00236653E2|nr:DUF4249 domain-containing protein [Mucilaginibacter sp. KACC 22773]WDF80071.1 DUF4249 domain-containing protein [Mucilaginibacter sp. KACC 22773]